MTWALKAAAPGSVELGAVRLVIFSKASSIMPSITSIKKERAERLFRWKQEGVHAASAYEAKEQATRVLTAKLRAERLAREAISGRPDLQKVAKA
jgi:hypothetical protein